MKLYFLAHNIKSTSFTIKFINKQYFLILCKPILNQYYKLSVLNYRLEGQWHQYRIVIDFYTLPLYKLSRKIMKNSKQMNKMAHAKEKKSKSLFPHTIQAFSQICIRKRYLQSTQSRQKTRTTGIDWNQAAFIR